MHTALSFRLISILLLAIATFDAHAQETYPSRPVRIVVPLAPGALSDGLSRAFATELGKILNQTVIVENKPGAGTVLGTQTAKRAPADGYTILFHTDALVSTTLAMKEPGYQPSDFKLIGLLGDTSFALMTPMTLPPKTLKEFVDYAKANPGKLNYAVLGVGGPLHVLAERFKRTAKFEWEAIPYKGGAPAYQALMANEVQGFFSNVSGALTFKEAGKLRVLAVAADDRSEFMPDVPTFKELGYDGIVVPTWTALFVRSDTPAPIVEKLRHAAAEVMALEVMKNHLRTFGMSPHRGSIDDVAATFPDLLKRTAEDMRLLGIQPQ
jgi:tripartite-type tricarboxylate transporter receptor subunit TctC